MERLPLASLLGLALLGGAAAGCMEGSAKTTASEEDLYRNPRPVQAPSLPPDATKPKGPAFIGEPTKATRASGRNARPSGP